MFGHKYVWVPKSFCQNLVSLLSQYFCVGKICVLLLFSSKGNFLPRLLWQTKFQTLCLSRILDETLCNSLISKVEWVTVSRTRTSCALLYQFCELSYVWLSTLLFWRYDHNHCKDMLSLQVLFHLQLHFIFKATHNTKVNEKKTIWLSKALRFLSVNSMRYKKKINAFQLGPFQSIELLRADKTNCVNKQHRL